MKSTDWDRYYTQPYITARYSARIIVQHYLKLIAKYEQSGNISIAELGGGGSRTYPLIQEKFKPREYHIIDNNQAGLDKFKELIRDMRNVFIYNQDVRNLTIAKEFDLVFSAGLIEHFSKEDTRRVILNHLAILKSGGLLIMGFPTPTILYRVTRKIAEFCGQWIFHDERPLQVKEVIDTIRESCDILEITILWRIFLTQAFVVARKR